MIDSLIDINFPMMMIPDLNLLLDASSTRSSLETWTLELLFLAESQMIDLKMYVYTPHSFIHLHHLIYTDVSYIDLFILLETKPIKLIY